MLDIVADKLSTKETHDGQKQTSTYEVICFKELYFNPGLYESQWEDCTIFKKSPVDQN